MRHELERHAGAEDLAGAAARYVATRARDAVAEHGVFHFAVSGGHTPWTMFASLATLEVPWAEVRIYQVDERVAPKGDPSRNLTHLRHSLADVEVSIVAMPVEGEDLERAAADYASRLPSTFDLVHLGLGPDGHTASLVPGDPVLEVTDRLVALTAPYQGQRRMTLTYPALRRAAQLLWLVAGADAHRALAQLLDGDPSIPASHVVAERSMVMTDLDAT